MEKFLYLKKTTFTEAWVHGGPIPLSLASKYKRLERGGVFTPDETLIHDSPVDLRSLDPAVYFHDVKRLTIKGTNVGGRVLPDLSNVSLYEEDGLIQSFCNVFDVEIAERLEKAACVRIFNIKKLRKHLDRRLGRRAQFGDCAYTDDHQRNHFLKGVEDSWQKEYRFFWANKGECEVVLPPSVAGVVWTI